MSPGTVEGISFALESGVRAAGFIDRYFDAGLGLSPLACAGYRAHTAAKVLPRFWAGEAIAQGARDRRDPGQLEDAVDGASARGGHRDELGSTASLVSLPVGTDGVHHRAGIAWSSAPRDLDSAADMFVGLDPRGGPVPAVTLDLGRAADMSALRISRGGRSPARVVAVAAAAVRRAWG